MRPEAAVAFLEEAARHFEHSPTGGEDRAHWANVYNALNCREIAAMIAQGIEAPSGDETRSGSSVGESPVPKACAQEDTAA